MATDRKILKRINKNILVRTWKIKEEGNSLRFCGFMLQKKKRKLGIYENKRVIRVCKSKNNPEQTWSNFSCKQIGGKLINSLNNSILIWYLTEQKFQSNISFTNYLSIRIKYLLWSVLKVLGSMCIWNISLVPTSSHKNLTLLKVVWLLQLVRLKLYLICVTHMSISMLTKLTMFISWCTIILNKVDYNC